MSGRRIIYTNRRPNYLAVMNVIFRPDMIMNYLHNHFCTEPADTWSANTRELLCNPVGYGIFQRFGQ
jgi:hypothetical protein